MSDAVRLLLLLALSGAAMTVLGSGAAFWLDEERRMRRLLRRALGGPPEAFVLARGRGEGAGLNFAERRAAVLWDGGVRGLVYRLDQLAGAELIVDGAVAARVRRDEPPRPLDHVARGADEVVLRLIFESPQAPDYALTLWPPGDARRLDRGSPTQAIQDGRRWLSAAEALFKSPRGAQARIAPAQPPPDEPAYEPPFEPGLVEEPPPAARARPAPRAARARDDDPELPF